MNQSEKIRKCTVFIGDLPELCTKENLTSEFKRYGRIINAKLIRSPDLKQIPLYAFIEFSCRVEAINAIRAMNGYILYGRPIRVAWAFKRDTKPVFTSTLSIFVSFIATGANAPIVTEDSLQEIYSKYGNAIGACIKSSAIDDISFKQKGYGFVIFNDDEQGYESVFRILNEMDEIVINNIIYRADLSHLSKGILRNRVRAKESKPETPSNIPLSLQKEHEQIALHATNNVNSNTHEMQSKPCYNKYTSSQHPVISSVSPNCIVNPVASIQHHILFNKSNVTFVVDPTVTRNFINRCSYFAQQSMFMNSPQRSVAAVNFHNAIPAYNSYVQTSNAMVLPHTQNQVERANYVFQPVSRW